MAAAATVNLRCDEENFTRAVEYYRPRLYHIALRQLGNPEDAQDALQDGLLLAYRHREQFQGRSEISTWLTRIVINAARGLRRKLRAHPMLELDALPAAADLFADPGPSPEAQCREGERVRRLRRMLARLSPALRGAVELYEIEGLSCREAAVRLGVTPATFKCRLFRGRARLAQLALPPSRRRRCRG